MKTKGMLSKPNPMAPIRIICGIARCSMPGEDTTGLTTLIKYQREVHNEIIRGLITAIIWDSSLDALLRRKRAKR